MSIYLLLGVALGVGTSLPPGPAQLAVINAACRHGKRRAIATGLGAALGDASYAALGILGLGPVLARHPSVPPILQAISALALVGYGLMNLRRPRATAPRRDHALGGLGVGLGLVLANPAAVVTWVVIVGSFLSGASSAQGWCAVAGIAAGTAGWYAVVAHLREVLAARVHRITRLVSGLLVAYGMLSLVLLSVRAH